MDKKEVINNMIKSKPITTNTAYKVHYYPNISDKVVAKVTKRFDHNMDINHIVTVLDTSLLSNCKNGIIFMVSGAYYLEILEKPFYFNYGDIEDINITLDEKIEIKFTNNNSIYIGSGIANFKADNLISILQELKELSLKGDAIPCFKPTGEVGKLHLTEEQRVKCHGIIHTAAVAAGGAGTGLAQIPLSDNAIITPIQITMIISLGAVFGIRVSEGTAKGILAGAASSFVGRGATQILVGWIPGLGNAINTATAAGITEAVGWMAVAHFFDLLQQDKAKHKVDGMKDGYRAASMEYEYKLRKQAEEFLKQKKNCKDQLETYESLLKEYEGYIQELEDQLDKTEEELIRLDSMKNEYRELVSCGKCS